MRRLILIASVWALAFAKPEMYKESEDFQYSRSSSDDGTKSGFYGAQRGNMGGNYERAHNMDGLAQHQMSTAVRQVEGELGQGAKTRTGSVYTSANSRGIFGSGNYDLSNLKGRNFEESALVDDSLSHSSLTSQNTGYRVVASQNTGYTKSSKHSSGYQSADYSGHHATDYTHADSLDKINNQRSYGSQAAAGGNYKYYSQGGSHSQNQFDANLHNVYDSNTYGRRVADTPVRVVTRPGTIMTIPVAPVYDAASLRSASYGQNSINTEAEELSNSDRHVYIKPDTIYYNKPKHYESSYSYRKEWEKHNAQPVASIPTENPFPKNSELYDDSLLLQNAKNALDLSSTHSSSANIAHSNSASAVQSNSYSANTKSAAVNKSKYRYESQTQNAAAAAHSNLYALGSRKSESLIDAYDFVGDIRPTPKSYKSSYSYHKSWERRGDPYVIKPAGVDFSGQTSQKLVSASANQGAYSSHQYGSLYNQDHHSYSQNGVDCDCDENGQIRVARSADPGYGHSLNQEQQQYDNLKDLGQQTQNQWDRLEDLGQQTQNKWDSLQDLGQQTQSQWDNLHDLGQQTQNQWNNLELLGQQTQSDFKQEQLNVGQETQNNWEKLEKFNEQSSRDIPQQTQDDLEPFHKQKKNEESLILIPTFNQYHGTEEQKVNGGDNFWDQKQNFNYQEVSQNNDQKESFSNVDFQKESSDQELQQQLQLQNQLITTMFDILNKNKTNNQRGGTDVNKPVSVSNTFYNQHNINYDATGKENTSRPWQSNYNDNGNTNKVTSPLENVWNKLGNLDSQGGFNINNDRTRDEDAVYNSQSSQLDCSQTKWENCHVSHDYKFNLYSTQKVEESSTVNPRGERTLDYFNIYANKPIQSIEKSRINNKAEDNPKSNVPVKPVDLGRGDIGADETKELDEETDNIFYNRSNKHYKTPEEIESLSLTKPKENTDKVISPLNHKKHGSDEILNHIVKNHENNLANEQKIVEHLSLSTQKREHMSTTIKTIDDKQSENHNTYNFNKELQQTTEKVIKQKAGSSVYDQQNVEGNIYNVESSPFDQQITDEESEDFGQNLQNSFDFGQQIQDFWQPSAIQKNTEQQLEDFSEHLDLGQQIQTSWEPSSNFEKSEVQQFENFGNNKNNNIQQNQGLPLEPQLEQFGKSNDQLESQSMINLEQQFSSHPVDYNKANQDLEQPAQLPNTLHSDIDHTPVNQRSQSVQIENQLSQQHRDEIPSPEEVATVKPGFWKSVGNKFSTAKETVVSWFKKS